MGEGNKTSMGIEQNLAGLLCYLVGWVTGLIFLLIEKQNRFVRFHAIQSIIISIPFIVLSFIPFLGWVIGILGFILWIFLMYNAYQGKMYKLPIIGDIAEKNSKPAA